MIDHNLGFVPKSRKNACLSCGTNLFRISTPLHRAMQYPGAEQGSTTSTEGGLERLEWLEYHVSYVDQHSSRCSWQQRCAAAEIVETMI